MWAWRHSEVCGISVCGAFHVRVSTGSRGSHWFVRGWYWVVCWGYGCDLGKMFGTDFSFSVGWCTAGGGWVSIFRDYFCGSVSKISFWGVVSYSPGIRSLQLSGSSWGSFDISCLLLIITVRFTCGEKKIW